MSNTVLIKRSGTSSVTPTSLESGEIAINYADGKIFYKNSSNTIIGAKLITGISGTANQVTVSETSGAYTLSLPSSVYVSSLFIDNIEIDTTGATPDYTLVYNGTKFVPSPPSVQTGPAVFSQTIGDGSNTTYNITHNLNTRDIVVSARNTAAPYEVVEVNWQATTVNAAAIIFSTAPSSNSIRISIYAASGVSGVTSLSGTTNQISVSQTTGSITLTLPNTLVVPGSLSVSGSVLFGLDALNDVTITSATPGQFLKYNGSSWVNDDIPQINALDDIGDVSIATATAGQYLKFDGTNWVNDSIPIINSIDDIGDVDLNSPASNQVLIYDGSNWVNQNLNAVAGTSYVQTIGNGSSTSITLTHNLGTRDVFVVFRQATSPYDILNVSWEATTLNTITAVFDTAPSSNSIRALVYAGFSTAQGTSYSTDVGNGSATEITVTHNLGTRDVLVSCRLNSSPYNDIQVSWEALTTNTLKLYFGEAPNSNEIRVNIFSNVVGGEVGQSVSSLTDTDITSPSNGQLLMWNGTNWINDDLVTIDSLSGLTDINITSASPDQFLKWDGSYWVNANVPQINSLDDITDVSVSTAVSGELLKWNGSAWVNSDTVQNLTVTGDLTVSGTTTTINTTELLIEDNLIVLNTGSAATPSYNAGIEVERGNFTNVQIRWNESTDKWQFTNDGSTYKDLGSGGVTVSDTIPSSPAAGDMWYESDTGALFAYYDSQWIEIGGSAAYNEIIGTIQAKGDLLVGDASQSLTRIGVGSDGTRLTANSATTTGVAWVADSTNTVIDAKGDLLVGTAADTVTRLAVGTDGQYLVADSNQASGVGWVSQNTRNLLYNGAMQVAQRGTSTASITTAGYYTADRWNLSIDSLGTWTQSVTADAPTGSGFRNSLKMACTTIDGSPAAGDYCMIQQRLEGQDLQSIKKGTSSAQQLTLSFWVKAYQTGTFIVEFSDQDNTRQISKSYTVDASATWEFKTITVPADTTGALDNDNARSLDIYFWLAAGSTFTSGTLNSSAWASTTNANRVVGQTNVASSTNNYWQITGVQLNVGPVAAPFEFKSYGRELRECQRYYFRLTAAANSALALGVSANSNTVESIFRFPVTMRIPPSSTIDQSGAAAYQWSGNVESSGGSFSVNQLTTDSCNLRYSPASGTPFTAGASAVTKVNPSTSGFVGFSAEL